MTKRRLYTVATVLFALLAVYEYMQGPLGMLYRNGPNLSLMSDNSWPHLLSVLKVSLCPVAYTLLATAALRGYRGRTAALLWELGGGLMAVYLLWVASPLLTAQTEDPYYWTYVATAARSGLLAVLWVLYALSARLVPRLRRRRLLLLCGFGAVYAVCAVVWAILLISAYGLSVALLPLLTDNLQSACVCFALWSLSKATDEYTA